MDLKGPFMIRRNIRTMSTVLRGVLMEPYCTRGRDAGFCRFHAEDSILFHGIILLDMNIVSNARYFCAP
jgi:hypothetical protein